MTGSYFFNTKIASFMTGSYFFNTKIASFMTGSYFFLIISRCVSTHTTVIKSVNK